MPTKRVSVKSSKKTKKKVVKKRAKKATKKKEPVPPKFTRRDFDSFYMGSLVVGYFSIMRQKEIQMVLDEFEVMATKLLDACRIAVHKELWYASEADNEDAVVKLFGDTETFAEKLKYNELTFEQCAELYRKFDWNQCFGGEPWAAICDEAAELEKMLPIFEANAHDIMIKVDRVIDLEHNTCLFMQGYCDFDMLNYLDDKSFDMVPEDFTEASSKMKTLVGKYVDDLTKT